ncbi:uncharacterized protein PHALS_09868 [Plasmopara halstedii]|uniref:Uncharacterized protein n=1 Tax=Plasmopara halstedii TaxID=4781 RepID=A0A0P1AG79_PLAHL|nr:uncharacterized protein PHALS_09868 [Plasmopara halstedii]CEG39630.1 hypothetical protein PHALS_09868 [Plasmopara halstedii]|eukprot:XP_024575999.1 hypothetical protein PHALS_09868 [Plasmopara halstedii]
MARFKRHIFTSNFDKYILKKWFSLVFLEEFEKLGIPRRPHSLSFANIVCQTKVLPAIIELQADVLDAVVFVQYVNDILSMVKVLEAVIKA